MYPLISFNTRYCRRIVTLVPLVVVIITLLSVKQSSVTIKYETILKTSTRVYTNVDKFVTLSMNCFDSRRTGNQLFNYAMLVLVSVVTNRTIIMPTPYPTPWLDDIFNFTDIYLAENWDTIGPRRTIKESYRPWEYDPYVLKQVKEYEISKIPVLEMDGYFQANKYLTAIESELRKRIRFKNNIINDVNDFWKSTIDKAARKQNLNIIRDSKGSTSPNIESEVFTVGVHIRRTDMILWTLKNSLNKLPNLGYFKKAVDFYFSHAKSLANQKNKSIILIFVICSDDLLWTKTIFDQISWISQAPFDVYVDNVYSVEHTPGFDMYLLSRCNSTIITVGSYGWWSAWLCGGLTVYFGKFPEQESNATINSKFKKSDYYPNFWIGLS